MDKIKLELTKIQFSCLIDVIDTVSAMIGTGDQDFNSEQVRNVQRLDKMLNSNGYKRKFK